MTLFNLREWVEARLPWWSVFVMPVLILMILGIINLAHWFFTAELEQERGELPENPFKRKPPPDML